MAFDITKPQETDTIKGSADNIRNNFIALLQDKFTIGAGTPTTDNAIDCYLYFDTTNLIFYQYMGGSWNPIAKLAVDSLVDVALNSLDNNQVLVWNSTIKKWVNSTIDSSVDVTKLVTVLKTSMTISDLANISIDTATLENGSVLQYDNDSKKWINKPLSSIDTKNTTGAIAKSNTKLFPVGILEDSINNSYAITYVNENFYVDETGMPKLGTQSFGSGIKPIYMADGEIKECTYTVEKSVPYDAVFTDTDTKYTAGDGLSLTGTEFSNSGIRALTFNAAGTATINAAGTSSSVKVYAVYAS